MTIALSAQEVADKLDPQFTNAVIEVGSDNILINSESLLDVASFLKTAPGLDFNYLSYITATDYYDYFELVYQLISLEHNHGIKIKARCHDRDDAVLPSLVQLWRGADYQEREIYDLLGISFEGHPNLKRIVLWDGFEGHPLRKDFDLILKDND